MVNDVLEREWSIPRTGETIAGKYVVEGTCGRGGLAVVLTAQHAELDRRVAIKMLLPEWAGDADVVERFVREGRAATRIRSEHVVRVFDVGTIDGALPYMVLEYLDGNNLEDVVARWGPLPVPTAIDWVLQAAEAIAEAHAYGIVHRDIKPSNLFLTRRADGTACVKVIDFGLSKLSDPRLADAKLTRPNDVMGSPHYMAPEQLRATHQTDTRADVWALGAVLHELLAGQPPFRGESFPELCATVLTQPPQRLSAVRENVPHAVEAAVLRCLEKDPDARFGSVAEMAQALAAFGTDGSRASCERIERVLDGPANRDLSPVPPPPADEDAQAWGDPRRKFVAPASARVVAGGVLLLAGIGAAVLMGMYEAVHSPDPDPFPPLDPIATAAPDVPSVTEAPTATPTQAPTATATATRTVTPTAARKSHFHPPPPRHAPIRAPAPAPTPAIDPFEGRK